MSHSFCQIGGVSRFKQLAVRRFGLIGWSYPIRDSVRYAVHSARGKSHICRPRVFESSLEPFLDSCVTGSISLGFGSNHSNSLEISEYFVLSSVWINQENVCYQHGNQNSCRSNVPSIQTFQRGQGRWFPNIPYTTFSLPSGYGKLFLVVLGRCNMTVHDKGNMWVCNSWKHFHQA